MEVRPHGRASGAWEDRRQATPTAAITIPPVPPTWRAAKFPRSMTVSPGRDFPTTTRRPQTSSVQTNSASDDVSASHTISWQNSMH
jgi:hypothetical protein